jgi:hypothetical protein
MVNTAISKSLGNRYSLRGEHKERKVKHVMLSNFYASTKNYIMMTAGEMVQIHCILGRASSMRLQIPINSTSVRATNAHTRNRILLHNIGDILCKDNCETPVNFKVSKYH